MLYYKVIPAHIQQCVNYNYWLVFLGYFFTGKWSPVHFMVKACSSNKLDECTGLNLILTYKPELECKNLAGDTALSLAVKLQCASSVDLLVSVKDSIMI